TRATHKGGPWGRRVRVDGDREPQFPHELDTSKTIQVREKKQKSARHPVGVPGPVPFLYFVAPVKPCRGQGRGPGRLQTHRRRALARDFLEKYLPGLAPGSVRTVALAWGAAQIHPTEDADATLSAGRPRPPGPGPPRRRAGQEAPAQHHPHPG